MCVQMLANRYLVAVRGKQIHRSNGDPYCRLDYVVYVDYGEPCLKSLLTRWSQAQSPLL